MKWEIYQPVLEKSYRKSQKKSQPFGLHLMSRRRQKIVPFRCVVVTFHTIFKKYYFCVVTKTIFSFIFKIVYQVEIYIAKAIHYYLKMATPK